jgi:ABC-2 type transport system ATP-binding protein
MAVFFGRRTFYQFRMEVSSRAEPLLLARELTKDYGSFRALDALSLSLEPGEIFGLLGPNGSGKSTAIRLLLGFHRATSGEVRIRGFDCWEQSVEVRRQVAYLPGELRLYENMTGRQLVRFLSRLRGEPVDSEIDAMASRLEIDLDRPLTKMSSGMKRKVALLQVLTQRVAMIILDEPTNTLDPVMRDELLEQLRLARNRGQSVLFSSHVLTEVEQVCDRVGILRQGKLVHVQSMPELREGRAVRGKFDTLPTVGPDGTPLTVRTLPHGEVGFEYRGPYPKLLHWLAEQSIRDVRIEPMGLAPIYQHFHGVRS